MLKRLAWLALAFALLVAGIEALHVLTAWWREGRPAPGPLVWLALAVLAGVGYAWWRHSIFNCARGQCLLPEDAAARPDAGGTTPDR